MKVAILSPVAWRTPPRHYGPWEQVASNITEGLVKKGIDVTLFATGDSITNARLDFVSQTGYEEDRKLDAKVAECLHIAHLMEQSDKFDLIHNNFDFLPITYSSLIKKPMLTTIHGFSSPKIIPVYKKYNDHNYYVSISKADRSPQLNYIATVYNGLKVSDFQYHDQPEDYLLYFGRIHEDKGTAEAIQIALKTRHQLLIAGIVQDERYFREKVEPFIDNDQIQFLGAAGPEKRGILLSQAKALLHPIKFEEPFGLSVAEAMLCGTPVIAFNRGSMPELIKDGETGFLVNDINEATEKTAFINKIRRENCRNWAALMFSQEKMVDDYIKVYEQIIS